MRILIAAFVSFLFQSLYLSKHGRFDDIASLSLFLISVYLVLEAVFVLLRENREGAAELGSDPEGATIVSQATEFDKVESAHATKLAQAQVIQFLAQLQHKGRFIDFVMDDVTGVSDTQIGAAARAVHQGCREYLKSSMLIVPLRSEEEGSAVTISAGFNPAEVRLLGTSQKEAPFSGKLLHRGWRASEIKLPILTDIEGTFGVVAPAEVELR